VKRDPRARRLAAGEITALTRLGEHCDTRRCRQPVAIVTWWWFRRHGQMRISERFICEDHGQEFARRHHLEIEP